VILSFVTKVFARFLKKGIAGLKEAPQEMYFLDYCTSCSYTNDEISTYNRTFAANISFIARCQGEAMISHIDMHCR
jgi:hypothetical protein